MFSQNSSGRSHRPRISQKDGMNGTASRGHPSQQLGWLYKNERKAGSGCRRLRARKHRLNRCGSQITAVVLSGRKDGTDELSARFLLITRRLPQEIKTNFVSGTNCAMRRFCLFSVQRFGCVPYEPPRRMTKLEDRENNLLSLKK